MLLTRRTLLRSSIFDIKSKRITRAVSSIATPVVQKVTSVPNYLTKDLVDSFPQQDQFVQTIQPKTLKEDFKLHSGVVLPRHSIQIKYATFGMPEEGKPIILLCPSMSNSVHAIDENKENGAKGWWNGVAGYGNSFGIDLNKFFVICAAPLGSPFGSTSPVTKKNLNNTESSRWGPEFPQITPFDQASLHRLLLKELNIPKVYAVVGGSMGGMQSIQFAANYPDMYDVFVSIASTAQTSPGIVALRSVQRAAVRTDPNYHSGKYYEIPGCEGPINGMRVARMFGTICYRSHTEFVERFGWLPDENNQFEVEAYLNHQADIFVNRSKYDANCWLLNSKSMDLMNIGTGFNNSFSEGVKNIPKDKHALLLSYSTDKLTPPEDLERLSSELGKNGVQVHYEVLESNYGHDAFLIEREAPQLNLRLKAFLENDEAVHSVQKLVKELLHD